MIGRLGVRGYLQVFHRALLDSYIRAFGNLLVISLLTSV